MSGGTGPFSYLWNNGLTTDSIFDLCPGNYFVTITDSSGCSALRTTNIGGSPGVTTTSSSSNLLCNGVCNGSASVTVTGGAAPFSYLWSPGGETTSSLNNLCQGNYGVTTTDANGCTHEDIFFITEPTALGVTLNTVNHVSCNGGNNGNASVTAGGGTPPYTYSWSPAGGSLASATGLTAGTYTVTVTDVNGCDFSLNVTVNEPPSLTLFMSSTDANCGLSNGTATCSPSGGTPPYTYAWSPVGGTGSTAINLAAGNYTVTVTDANSCIQTSNVSVNNAGSPSLTLQSFTDVLCHGDSTGSASVSVSGGSPPFTYSWSPIGGNGQAASNIPAGSYVVTVTDNGNCITTLNVTIHEPDSIALNLQTTNISCFGNCDGSALTNVTGGTGGFTYSWCNGSTAAAISNLCATSCSLMVTDANGCVTSRNFNITQPGSAMSVSTAHADASCAGCPDGWASAVVNGGNSPYSYLWNTIPPQTTSLISNLLQGTYTVCVTDANNCTVCDSVEILDASMGVNELSHKSSPVYVYPNPLRNTTSFIFSLSRQQKVLLQVYDARGKMVLELMNEERVRGDHVVRMNASGLSEGVYHYHFRTEERVQDGSLIIQR